MALVGGAAWAGYSMFFATGPQPAEALPASTVGYVSVDLDPSGKQKIEALETLRRFPAFADNVDVAASDDLRERIFEQIQGGGVCPELDFETDIDPWLGDRFAAATIDLGDADPAGSAVTGVGVLQLDDAGRAEDGLAALSGCGGQDEAFGWSIVGDWAVIAETTEMAQDVTDAAAEAPLSQDDDFTRWTDEAGEPGILTAYVSPAAASLIADAAAAFSDFSAFSGELDCLVPPVDPSATDPFATDPFGTDPFATDPFASDLSGSCGDAAPPDTTLPDSLSALADDFQGAALTIRFADGGFEVEAASGISSEAAAGTGDAGDEVVATLPADTAIALGVGLEDGWSGQLEESLRTAVGQDGLEAFLSGVEQSTGLDLPADLETLLGDSTAIALGGDADLTAFNAPEPPADLQLGAKVTGEADDITGVLDRLVARAGDPTLATLLAHDSEGDVVVAGPSADYRASLLEDGGLGDTDAYRDAVLQSQDAAAVFFVNFDAGSWLTSLPDLPEEVRDNLAPLHALGLSGWADDDVSHVALRITTD